MKIKELLSFMADLTLKTGYPVPVPKDFAYRWAMKYNFERKGKTVLYTGALYQLIPYIESLSIYLRAMEKSDEGAYLALRFARNIPQNIIEMVSSPDKSLIQWSESVLASISSLLIKNGFKFSYLYENDLYSGVLLYDMGIEDKFELVAKRIYKTLKDSGAGKVITVDPHTTHIMKKIYPKYIDNFDLDVNSYLELIDVESDNKGESITIHDSCIYARGLSIIDKPRELLRKKGFDIKEPRRNRELTYCCGGPVESIFPSLSNSIASNRVDELSNYSNKVVTMCPICYVNLVKASKNKVKIYDISEML